MTSKIQLKVYEDKIKYLQLYLEHLIKDKENIKQQLDDMRITAQKNKELLKEYIYSITSKDQIVEKLQCTIENLQERINNQEEYIKKTITNKNNKTLTEQQLKGDIDIISMTNRHIIYKDDSNISMTNRKINSNIVNNEFKEVFCKQKTIMDELELLKKELHLLFDNCDVYAKKDNKKNNDNDSCSSNTSTQSTKIKKICLSSKFEENNILRLNHVLKSITTDTQDVALLIDSDYRVFELIYRKDLNYNSLLNNPQSILSFLKKNNDEVLIKEEFINIDKQSFNSSKLEISQNTDFFNISQMMEDTLIDDSDVF